MRIRTLAAILFLTSLSFAESAWESPPPSPGERDVVPRTLLCPAWGSWGMGSPTLTIAQFTIDALAVAAIAGDLGSSHSPDAGSGLVALSGLVVLAANRLLSLPLNLYAVSAHSVSGDPPARSALAGKDRHFGLFAGLGSYGNAPGLGLSLESKYIRGRAAFAFSSLQDDAQWSGGADSIWNMESLEQKGYWDLGLEGILPVTHWLRIHPGLQLLVKDYRVRTSAQRENAPYESLRLTIDDSRGLEWIPSLAMSLHPWPSLALDLGAGWSMGLPAVEREYLARNRVHAANEGADPLRLHCGFEVFLK
ncbi:MAG: hypothetical protein JWO30_2108 [Fibrobacteres bacterium]|nr:hypothetical protein [Fibrobacterota bacterium]